MTTGQRQGSAVSAQNLLSQDDREFRREQSSPTVAHNPDCPVSIGSPKLPNTSSQLLGYLGATSYSAVFTEGQKDIVPKESPENNEAEIEGWQNPRLLSLDSSKIKEGAAVLSQLAEIPKYTQALVHFYMISTLGCVAPYIHDCINLLPSILTNHGLSEAQLISMSYKVFQRTSSPYSIPDNLIMRDYASFLMGDNMCWETVGLILTVTGLGAMSMDEIDVVDRHEPHIDWKGHAQKMVQAGNQCIAFCEDYGHLSDLGVTLIFMNFLLHTQVYGDAGS